MRNLGRVFGGASLKFLAERLCKKLAERNLQIVATFLAALALVAPTPPRLLVAGGTGFVGREICREAVARGWAAE